MFTSMRYLRLVREEGVCRLVLLQRLEYQQERRLRLSKLQINKRECRKTAFFLLCR